MKGSRFRIGFASISLLAIAACAASGNEDTSPPLPSDDAGNTMVGSDGATNDGSPNDAGANDANVPDGALELCSEAGWCDTPLPSPGTTVVDLWPLADRAFALASVGAYAAPAGYKIMEWDESAGKWSYVDDNSQNDIPSGTSWNLWAPSKDEVYFTVADKSQAPGAYLYHGTRAVPPAPWSWTRIKFECNTGDAPQVWGTGPDDVYFWACQTIYHRQPGADADAGTSAWIPEWTNDTPGDRVTLFGFAATAPDDVWFVGARGLWLLGGCTTIIRKTAGGYRTVVDSTGGFFDCTEKPGIPMILGSFANDFGLDGFIVPAKGQLVAIQHDYAKDNKVVRVDVSDDGGVTVSSVGSPAGTRFNAIWGTSAGDFWLLGSRLGVSLILRGEQLWSDGGTLVPSTLVRNGLPNLSQLYRIRGTSNSNLWAVGTDHAYHKSTP